MIGETVNHFLPHIQFLYPLVIALVIVAIPLDLKKIKVVSILALAFYLLFEAYVAVVSDGLQVLFFKNFPGFDVFGDLNGLSTFFIMANILIIGVVLCIDKDFRKGSYRKYYTSIFIALWATNAALASNDLFGYFIFSEIALIPLLVVQVFRGEQPFSKFLSNTKILIPISSAMILSVLVYLSSLLPQESGHVINAETIKTLKLPFDGFTSPQSIVFLMLSLSMFIKMGGFPFHGWSIETMKSSSLSVKIIVMSSLLFVGVYGLIRYVLPNFPEAIAYYKDIILIGSTVGACYFAINALRCKSRAAMVGYHSLLYVSLIIAGVFLMDVDSLNGAVILAVGKSMTVVLLLLVLHHFAGKSEKETKALKSQSLLKFIFLMVFLVNISLPLTINFVGVAHVVSLMFSMIPVASVVVVVSLALQPIYLLGFYYELAGEEYKYGLQNKLTNFEVLPYWILPALIFIFGVLPEFAMNLYQGVLKILL